MAISFNSEVVQKSTIAQIHLSIVALENARTIASSITPPGDFPETSQLMSIPNELTSMINEARMIENFLKEMVNKFDQAEQKNKSLLDGLLGNIPLSKRIGALSGTLTNLGASNNMGVISSFADPLSYFASRSWMQDARATATAIGAKIGTNVNSNSIFDDIGKAFSDAGETIGNFFSTTGASVGNAVIALGKGVASLGEALVDGAVIWKTTQASMVTSVIDGIRYLFDRATGNSDKWESMTWNMWKNTMGFVAKEHVDSAFKGFYNKTKIGKWLDNNAIEIFKSAGIGSQIINGVGYIGGIILASIATGGVAGIGAGAGTALGTGAATTGSAIAASIAGTAALGKYAQEDWSAKREHSWEGLQSRFRRGEISYEEMLKYRINTPKEWKTPENLVKGLEYAGTNAIWESAQFFLGGEMLIGKYATLGVLLDAGLNALDTPVRAGIDSVVNRNNFVKSFEERGGFTSMIADLGIGAAFAGGGTLLRNAKLKNIDAGRLTEFFDKYSKGSGKFGVDQGMLKTLFYDDIQYHDELVQMLQTEYKMPGRDAYTLLRCIDNMNGVCPYANDANIIFEMYKDNPIAFERDLGFPMTRIGPNGEKALNDGRMLLDLYYTLNHKDNGGMLIQEVDRSKQIALF